MKTITSGVVGVSNSSLIKVATFNYDGTTEIVYTSIVLESLRTDSSYDCTFYPMLMKDTHTADVTYEQYGASPSPGYLSEIETVGSNVNEFNINTVSYGDLDTATGQKINDATNIQHSDYIEVVSNENYIINFNNTLTKRVFYLDKNKNVISTNIVSTEISKFTTSENIKYFRVKIVGAFDKKTKLEKGSVATPYSSYRNG